MSQIQLQLNGGYPFHVGQRQGRTRQGVVDHNGRIGPPHLGQAGAICGEVDEEAQAEWNRERVRIEDSGDIGPDAEGGRIRPSNRKGPTQRGLNGLHLVVGIQLGNGIPAHIEDDGSLVLRGPDIGDGRIQTIRLRADVL